MRPYFILLSRSLPSRSDVEKKRQILQHVTFYRQQILKLQVLVKWAEDANDIQMCQVQCVTDFFSVLHLQKKDHESSNTNLVSF